MSMEQQNPVTPEKLFAAIVQKINQFDQVTHSEGQTLEYQLGLIFAQISPYQAQELLLYIIIQTETNHQIKEQLEAAQTNLCMIKGLDMARTIEIELEDMFENKDSFSPKEYLSRHGILSKKFQEITDMESGREPESQE
jgi:hypothetical protein